ncbi:MAG: DNA-binding response regulator [Spirochaetes bacterium]|nr:MAG: DNA-binding response regulator [Spirochaetota bacterium]
MATIKKKNTAEDPDRILLIEDEDSLAIGLAYNLLEEGYEVKVAKDGKLALEIFKEGEFDLIILDIMLPYIDGFEVARRIRSVSEQIPILMLTAKGGVNDRIKGLEIGADDYLVKPFHLDELLLRVKGMIKRKRWYRKSRETRIFRFGDIIVNFDTLECKTLKGEVKLTVQEALLLRFFIENRGRLLSRKEILRDVWGIQSEVETRTVDNFVARLRKYFEKDPKNPEYLQSRRSAGYIFTANVTIS